jgi:Tol biopolymer transport system component
VRSGRLSKTLSPSNEGPIIRTAFSPVDDDALFGLVAAKEGESPGWQVRRWNRRGERMDDVTPKQMGNARLMRVSPDGTKIAVSTFSTWDEQAVRIFDVSPRVAPDR